METASSQQTKAYNALFNGITDSIILLQQAEAVLVKAQQAGEKTIIDHIDKDGRLINHDRRD